MYLIYSAIRQGFSLCEWLQITKSVLLNYAKIQVLPFLNNPKDLDPSYKIFGTVSERKKKLCLITEEIQYPFTLKFGQVYFYLSADASENCLLQEWQTVQTQIRPRSYKTFLMLNSAEHEIPNACKYENSRNSAFFRLRYPYNAIFPAHVKMPTIMVGI